MHIPRVPPSRHRPAPPRAWLTASEIPSWWRAPVPRRRARRAHRGWVRPGDLHSYYTGHTDDLDRRLAQHVAGECGGYSARRRPVELMFQAPFPTRIDALAHERQVKGWGRGKKAALIRGDWQEVRRLARSRSNAEQ
ncbi:MAG: GIY-YIG nuclease family protein [Candidatus Binatia bacterium]